MNEVSQRLSTCRVLQKSADTTLPMAGGLSRESRTFVTGTVIDGRECSTSHSVASSLVEEEKKKRRKRRNRNFLYPPQAFPRLRMQVLFSSRPSVCHVQNIGWSSDAALCRFNGARAATYIHRLLGPTQKSQGVKICSAGRT